MNKSIGFIDKFRLRVARYINGRTGKLINELTKKEEQSQDRSWSDLFIDKKSIVHLLEDNVKVNLYKDSILARWMYNGFEQDEAVFLKSVLRKGDIFVDAGCNIGYFSLQAAHFVGEEGKVVCFEPSPVTYKRLTENILLNGFKNISAVNKGLSDQEGEMQLNISESGYDAWNTFAKATDNKFQSTVAVNVSTLDKELVNFDKSRISLVKIDVEGWEKFVLLGAKDFFTGYSPAVMVEFTEANTYAAGYFVQEVYDIMAGWGYQWFRFVKGELVPEERKLHYPYDNLIATKDIGSLRSRLS